MNIFNIPYTLSEKYHGTGHALASVTGGQIVDLIYLRDIIENFDSGEFIDFPKILNDSRLSESVQLLQATGEVYVGMCSCYEFVAL